MGEQKNEFVEIKLRLKKDIFNELVDFSKNSGIPINELIEDMIKFYLDYSNLKLWDNQLPTS